MNVSLRLKHALEERRLRQMLAKIALEVGEDMPEEKVAKHKRAADPMTLRGIPAMGPGIPGGTISGTSPEVEALRSIEREEQLRKRLAELSEEVA